VHYDVTSTIIYGDKKLYEAVTAILPVDEFIYNNGP
jgi:hypothetical protein